MLRRITCVMGRVRNRAPDWHGLRGLPYRSNMRRVAIMHGVAQNLKLLEMQAVAALEVQR